MDLEDVAVLLALITRIIMVMVLSQLISWYLSHANFLSILTSYRQASHLNESCDAWTFNGASGK